MRLARPSLICALTRLVSRNAEATNIDVAVGATFFKPNGSLSLAKQRTRKRFAARQRERTIFARCNPTILCRRFLSLMDSAEIG